MRFLLRRTSCRCRLAAMSPMTRRHTFNLGWELGRIFQRILEAGTQNAKGEWRVVEFQEPLGAKIEKPR